MDGDEQGRRQGDGHTMQNIKPQERVPAHEASAQENEARIAPRMNQVHIPDPKQLRARPFVSEEWCRSNVSTSRITPTPQLNSRGGL